MSLPKFPSNDPPLTREDVINQIISSIAMEELGLSHIINAEGEKLQYALGTIEGMTGPVEDLTLEDLLKLNDSVHETLNGTMMNQFFLKEKLVKALSASVMQGPTGPRGPQGPTTIKVNPDTETLDPGTPAYVRNTGTEDDLELQFGIPKGATGATGATPNISVGNVETVDYPADADVKKDPTSTETDVIFDFWIPRGPTGPGIRLLNSYDDPTQFDDEHPVGNPGDSYMVGGYLLTWDETSGSWLNLGYFRGPAGTDGMSAFELAEEQGFTGDVDEWLESLRGETGPAGPQGEPGESAFDIAVDKGFTGTEEEWLESLKGEPGPQGEPGESAFDIAVDKGFTGTEEEWLKSLKGATGETGPRGDTGPRGPIGSGGSIIPFSSGVAEGITSFPVTGARSDVVIIGFGDHIRLTAATTDPIVLSSAGLSSKQLTFSMPEDGMITAMSFFVSVVAAQLIVVSNIFLQLYSSTIPDNTFYPVDGAVVGPLQLLPASGIGTTLSGNVSNLSIPVTAGTRLMFVAYQTSPGLSTTPTLLMSGGIKIASVEPEE